MKKPEKICLVIDEKKMEEEQKKIEKIADVILNIFFDKEEDWPEAEEKGEDKNDTRN